MKLKMSFDPGTRLSEMSRRLSISAYVGLLLKKEESEITIFFPGEAKKNRELAIFMKGFDAVERSGIWRVRRKVERSLKFVQATRDILAVPSAVMTEFWLSSGRYRVEFIFSTTDLKAVSDILVRTVTAVDGTNVEYLGKNSGFIDTFSSFNRKMSLSVVEIDHIPPEDEMKVQSNPLGDRWMRITKTPFGYERIPGLYFVDRPPLSDRGIETVIPGEIYHADTSNAYAEYMSDMLNREMVAPVVRLYEFNKPNFIATVIMPEILSPEYLRIFGSSIVQLSSWRPVLKHFSDFSTWVEYRKSVHQL